MWITLIAGNPQARDLMNLARVDRQRSSNMVDATYGCEAHTRPRTKGKEY